MREQGNMGGAMYPNSSVHHSHHNSEAEQEARPVDHAGPLLLYRLMVKLIYCVWVCMYMCVCVY